MTHEDKSLLLRDLCSRLPYGIKCSFGVDDAIYIIEGINPNCCGASEIQATHLESSINGDFRINSCKPYLYSLSSMTKKQKEELRNLGWNFDNFEIHNVNECLGTYREFVTHSDCSVLIDWLNKNHFDYRSLIPKGLAIDCINLNIY